MVLSDSLVLASVPDSVIRFCTVQCCCLHSVCVCGVGITIEKGQNLRDRGLLCVIYEEQLHTSVCSVFDLRVRRVNITVPSRPVLAKKGETPWWTCDVDGDILSPFSSISSFHARAACTWNLPDRNPGAAN